MANNEDEVRRTHTMLITAKHLITGDGITCLEDAALYIGPDGRIGWLGSQKEAEELYPQEKICDYGEATILPGLTDCVLCAAAGKIRASAGNHYGSGRVFAP